MYLKENAEVCDGVSSSYGSLPSSLSFLRTKVRVFLS
jgi:hypothetical protein